MFRRIADNLGLCSNLKTGYQCNQCAKNFSRESSLKSHMKTHHGDGGSEISNMSVANSVSSSLGESSSEVEDPVPMRSLRNRSIPTISSCSEVEEPVPMRSLRNRSIPTVSSFSEVSSAESTTTNARY